MKTYLAVAVIALAFSTSALSRQEMTAQITPNTQSKPSPTPLQLAPAGIMVGWGDPVDGVQFHLGLATVAPNEPRPTAVELPRLEGQMRNRGSDTVAFVFDFELWDVEIDGTWYRHGGFARSGLPGCIPVLPGAESRIVPLKIRDDNLVGLGPGKLKSGKHTVRVRTAALPDYCSRGGVQPKGVVVISNALEIDIPDVPAAVQRKALVDAVSAGGTKAQQEVSKLIERFPDAALEAIKAGIRVTGSEEIRGSLTSYLSGVPGDGVTTYLKTKLGADTDLPSRSAAIWILSRRGDRQAIPAALQLWREVQPTLRVASNMKNFGYRDAVGKIITVLGTSGNADAIDTLARDSQRDPIAVRLSVLKLFLPPTKGGSGSNDISFSLWGEVPEIPGGPPLPANCGSPEGRYFLAAVSIRQ